MSDSFEKTINERKYIFDRYLSGNEAFYNVSVDDKEHTVTFKLKQDESGMWKIQPQTLPDFIKEESMALNDAIEDNINDPLN